MSLVDNSSFGPPPLATPITAGGSDEFGVPWQLRKDQGGIASGNVAVSWDAWFNQLYQEVLTLNELTTSIKDTHADRLAAFPSVLLPDGATFFEVDRTVTYQVEDAIGTVTVSGGVNVAWTSGNHFINTGSGFNAAQWPSGTKIIINNTIQLIASVTSPTALTIQTATTNGTFAYTVFAGRWVYVSGTYSSALANLPSDLGENDIGFLFFENAAYAHQLQWNGTAWTRGPQDQEHSDTFHEFGAFPSDIGWHHCDGTTVTYLKYDGTTGSRILPNTDATAAYAKGGSSYSATLSAPASPTVSGSTDGTSLSLTGASSGSVNAGAGSPATFLTSAGSITPNPHSHTLTGVGVSLTGDPIENFSVIRAYRL